MKLIFSLFIGGPREDRFVRMWELLRYANLDYLRRNTVQNKLINRFTKFKKL